MKVSEELKLYQQENNYSNEELANLLNVSKSSIYSYLKGTRKPSLKILKRIANLLKVNPMYFLNVEKKDISELTFLENLRLEPEVYDFLLSNGKEEIERIKKRLQRKC